MHGFGGATAARLTGDRTGNGNDPSVDGIWDTAYPRETQRWVSFGPYYAMFPVEFARQVVRTYTRPGEAVLDPFSGRGTSVFCAAEAGRTGVGIEINPVGWLYSAVKLCPAPKDEVLRRLAAVCEESKDSPESTDDLLEFFEWCFSPAVLAFLLKARATLQWRTVETDATLMAFILVYLHGKIGAALSNQMRQTKAMSPDYSVRWWRDKGMLPPALDPVEFLSPRIEWRYARGTPRFEDSAVLFGDARDVLP